ncbi:DAK2 domain-containing protein [Alkalicoccus urumqiensis]|uniref:DhaL domain-containing protein n=1 Tax=Alkalicoccus urumqiensis TaxID=1548213 RepID=A0A2P6MG49_ALKUR|nr:DAK2 domain-containing protein [Alkalicoccus urumqiensis]PRO65269.1 hypothetical protein C6I21_10735 [Alkalicoccus urumqiensis]
MSVQTIQGEKLVQMIQGGAANLSAQSKKIDALNVFPVPDGDTGTNMNLTMTSGVKEMKAQESSSAGVTAGRFAKGLLMGARGNSGVILSQLFRGFSKALEGKESVSGTELAEAFQQGVETAYKAVMKPVEGTILTVAKDSAKAGWDASVEEDDCTFVMKAVTKEAKASLERTPDLLPVLKEVGVVDSGGQGLLTIYEAFEAVLEGKEMSYREEEEPSLEELVKMEHHQSAQSHMNAEDITFTYCTEVMVKFDAEKLSQKPFDEDNFREKLSEYGDSLLVVSDEELLKIHIHADFPGEVINEAQQFGSLVQIKAENMRDQHESIVNEPAKKKKVTEPAVITVGMGSGIKALFEGLGAYTVIEGGQTMNPSTEDFIRAIDDSGASRVILLPNNGNIIMAAEQAAEVADADVRVVKTKSVPQGLAAMLAYEENGGLDELAPAMEEASTEVKTGEVTYAVRDTSIDGTAIKKGDYMGISGKKILNCGTDVAEVAQNLLQELVDGESEIVTLIYGEDRTAEEADALASFVEEKFPEVEVEVHEGSQPLYSYIISVE